MTKSPKDVKILAAATSLLPADVSQDCSVIQQEYEWLHSVHSHFNDAPTKDLGLSWSAFHANEHHSAEVDFSHYLKIKHTHLL